MEEIVAKIQWWKGAKNWLSETFMHNLKKAGANQVDAVLAMQAGDSHTDPSSHLDQ